MFIFNHHVEYIKELANEMADWLSRSAQIAYHNELSFKEEIIINSIVEDNTADYLEYPTYMSQLTKVVENNNWSDKHIRKYPRYHRIVDKLTVKNGKLFLGGTRFIPELHIARNNKNKYKNRTTFLLAGLESGSRKLYK